jgi:hypothetical protein
MLPLDMPLLPPPVCDWNEKKPQASVLGKYLREAALRGDLMGFQVMQNAQVQ